MATNREKFEAQMVPYAEQASKATGIPVSVILGQWALESNWGTSKLSTKRLNFGGISQTKNAVPSWSDAVGTVARPANEGGFYLVYNSIQSFVNDYITVMKNSRYASVRQAGVTPGVIDDIEALKKSGYAASGYAQSTLPGIIKSLAKYDKKKVVLSTTKK